MSESCDLERRMSALTMTHIEAFCAALIDEELAVVRHALWRLARAAEERHTILGDADKRPFAEVAR